CRRATPAPTRRRRRAARRWRRRRRRTSSATARRSDRERLGLPHEPQLGRRAHVAEQRARRDDAGRGEIAFAADAHAVRPVAIEARDRALAGRERIGALAETRAAPALADLAARGAEHLGDALAVESRIGLLDLALHAARAGEDHEFLRRLRAALRPRRLE